MCLQNEKIAQERKLKLQSKEIEKEEREKRLEKLRNQVYYDIHFPVEILKNNTLHVLMTISHDRSKFTRREIRPDY